VSSVDYDEMRLHRENMSEEIGRAFHEATSRVADKYGLPPLSPWDDLSNGIRESIKAAVLDMIDHRVIAPFPVVNNLQTELNDIKQTWRTLNAMMGVK
jgi:hypothetical protein